MSARGGLNLFSGFGAKFQRLAWTAGLKGRGVARSGGRALEALGPRRYLTFAHDIAMAALAFYLAYLVAADPSEGSTGNSLALSEWLYALLPAIGIFGSMRLHRRPWSRFDGSDIRAVVKAALGQTLLLATVLALAFEFDLLSFRLILLNWVLLTGLLLTPRALANLFQTGSARAVNSAPGDTSGRLPVLLVGAGDRAESFIRATEQDPNCLYRAVGVVDEMGPYLRSNVAGVEILGRITEIPVVVRRLVSRGVRPRVLVITEDRLSPQTMRMLLDEAAVAGLALKRADDVDGRQHKGAGRASLRSVPVDEFLDGRDPHPDVDAMRGVVANTRVLITGAGGPVGAALARKVCEFGPAHVTLVDDDESSLFDITRELQTEFPAGAPFMALCDVRDRDHVRNIFARHRPQLVFHTAAMTHEAVAEDHPCEAVLANVMATRNVAESCTEFGATAMVLVSSLEAADPVGVVGQTRKIAELICRLLDRRGHQTAGAPRLMSLRLPHILRATDSLDSQLERQLANGGPLVLPSPDSAKSFITASAAAMAVLEAAVIGLRCAQTDGRVFTIATTAPVLLRDLANLIVRLAGLVPEKDVKIAFAGPWSDETRQSSGHRTPETLRPTDISGLMQVLDGPDVDFDVLEDGINGLIASAHGRATERVRAELTSLLAGDPRVSDTDGGGTVTQLKR